jgi:hypothetical protein
MHKLPHLTKNRFGVYYLRLVRSGRETKRSLRTKDFRQATLLALAFNLELAMKTPNDKPKATDFHLDTDSLKRLDVVFPDGTQVKDIKTDDDVRRAKELFGDRFPCMQRSWNRDSSLMSKNFGPAARRRFSLNSNPAKTVMERMWRGALPTTSMSAKSPTTAKCFTVSTHLHWAHDGIERSPGNAHGDYRAL